MVGAAPVNHILKFAMHALDYCSQIALNFIKIHPVCEDVSHLQKYFLTPSAFLCSAPCCPFTSHQTSDFCDTLGELTHTVLFQATQQQKTTQTQRALASMRELSCPCQVCAHTCTNPPTPQERCQSKRLSAAAHPQLYLLPGAQPFHQYVKQL